MGPIVLLLLQICFCFAMREDLSLSLSDNNQADVIEAFNYTSRYLDNFLNIDNPFYYQHSELIGKYNSCLNTADNLSNAKPAVQQRQKVNK